MSCHPLNFLKCAIPVALACYAGGSYLVGLVTQALLKMSPSVAPIVPSGVEKSCHGTCWDFRDLQLVKLT